MKFFKPTTTIFYRFLAITATVFFVIILFSGKGVSGIPIHSQTSSPAPRPLSLAYKGGPKQFPSCVIASFVKLTQACHDAFFENLQKGRIRYSDYLVTQCCALEEYRLCQEGVANKHCSNPKDHAPFVEFYHRLARASLAHEHDAKQMCAERIDFNGTLTVEDVIGRCMLQEKVNRVKAVTNQGFTEQTVTEQIVTTQGFTEQADTEQIVTTDGFTEQAVTEQTGTNHAGKPVVCLSALSFFVFLFCVCYCTVTGST